MLDLVNGLPNVLVAEGRPFLLNTDFRLWLPFGELLDSRAIYQDDINPLFSGEAPDISQEVVDALAEFYYCVDKYPVLSGGGEKVVSFFDDGGYVYADFKREYGINLLTDRLHWHEFQALFRGLSCSMSDIMSTRAYAGKDSGINKRKASWRIQDDKPQSGEAGAVEAALRGDGDLTGII